MTADEQRRERGWQWWLLRAALLINLSLALGYIGLWTIAAQQELFWRADFSAFYTGWAMVRDGHGPTLYDFALQERYQQAILEGRSFRDGLLPYVNPPHLTLPFVPLAWLPRTEAYWVWTAGQLALLLWLLRRLWTLAAGWTAQERVLLLVTTLAFPPLFNTFLLGTFSLLVLVCLVELYRALGRGQEGRAGLWLVLGMIKMQLMVFPGLVLLAGRRWRALVAAALLGGGLALLAGLVLGWESWAGYARALQAHSGFYGRFGIEPATMYNVKGMLTLLLGDEQGQLIGTLSLAALAVTTLLAALLWRGMWRPQAPSFDARLALTLVLGLLVSPHLNTHDALLLVLPAMLFYGHLRAHDGPIRAYAAFVLSCPLLFLVSELTIGGSLGVRVPFVAMLVLAGWIALALAREQPAVPAPVSDANADATLALAKAEDSHRTG